MSERKETVGKIALDLMQKTPDSLDPNEIGQESQKEYMKELIKCVEDNLKVYLGDFFVEVQVKRERLLPNVFRNYFFARQSCPTPNYDQSVFRFNRKSENIEYIWTVPDKETSYHLLENAKIVAAEEQELLMMVYKFANGDLFRLCKKFNNEEIDSPLLVKE